MMIEGQIIATDLEVHPILGCTKRRNYYNSSMDLIRIEVNLKQVFEETHKANQRIQALGTHKQTDHSHKQRTVILLVREMRFQFKSFKNRQVLKTDPPLQKRVKQVNIKPINRS